MVHATLRFLALCAAISVSGIHLPAMQAGAWAIMFCERSATGQDGAFSHLAVEIVSGAKPCQRCLVTRQAAFDSQGAPGEDQRAQELPELRLVPSEQRAARLVPPPPRAASFGQQPEAMAASWHAAPPSPPPDALA